MGITFLRSPDPEFRRNALEALSVLRAGIYSPEIARLLTGSDEDFAQSAARALGAIGATE